MELKITARQAGKKRPLIENRIIEIADIGPLPTVRLLINAVVAQQVGEYNSKPHEKNLIPFWTPSGMEEQLQGGGKVGFGSLYNEHRADLEKAQQTALQAFEDGLFALFAGDIECPSLDTVVHLDDHIVISFIRLTFLAGGYW